MTLYLGENLISGVATPIEPTRNIGQIVHSTLPLNDVGLHLIDGALIDGNGIYAEFVDYIATLDQTAKWFTDEATWQQSVLDYGVCGKFVYDAAANTVRLPKITGFIEGTTDLNALSELIEAGLPNIEGRLGAVASGTSYNTFTQGAFINPTIVDTANTWGSSSGNRVTYDFDASKSNPIYDNSDTVQPQAINVIYYIVIATSTKTNVEVNIDNIATDLNGKADVDLNNINASQSAKNKIISWGMPDYSSGISVSGNGFTASTDGIWYVLAYNTSALFSYIVVNNITTACGIGGTSGYQDQSAIALYLSKGDVVTWSANPSSIYSSTFYPLKGAK